MLTIQLGHPKVNQGPFPVCERLRDAFLLLFRAEEESVYLFWHEIPIRVRYRQDLYEDFDDILAMVWLIQRDKQGGAKAALRTQLLSILWELRWADGVVTVSSTFVAGDAPYAPYALALNQRPEIQMDKHAFLSEWKTLLHQVVVSFRAGGIEIQDGTERRKWELLQRVENQISGYGRLYTAST